jgi:hypothetical protein
MSWTAFEHFSQIFFMAAIILGSHALSRRTHRERVHHDARRLRSALTISLPALRKLYEDNLSILSGGERLLISGRNQINLLRTQLGRLTSLDPPEIEAVMAASIAAERAETAMGIADRKIGGVACIISGNHEAKKILESTLREVCSMLETAEELLNPHGTPRQEKPSAVPPTREPDIDEVGAHVSAHGFSNAARQNQLRREKAKLRELSL